MTGVLIAVPQLNELQPLLAGFSRLGHHPTSIPIGRMECFSLPSLDMVVAVGGHGKAQFAIQTQYLVDRLDRVSFLLCVGAAGCLTDALRLGDVVVGTQTVEHDYKLRFVKAPAPIHLPDPTMLDQLHRTVAMNRLPFGVHFGPIASGDEDIVDGLRAQKLKAETGAICVAWEGSGGARTASFNGIGFAEVRCITDGADPHAPVSFRENCTRALPNAAELLIQWRGL